MRSAPGGVRVDAFEGGARSLVQHADRDGDGRLSPGEWTRQLVMLGAPDPNEPQWVPDMKAAVLRNSVAQVTGEPDPLNVGGGTGQRIVHGYDIVEMNERGHVPEVVAYLASDSDFAAKSLIDGATRELHPETEVPLGRHRLRGLGRGFGAVAEPEPGRSSKPHHA